MCGIAGYSGVSKENGSQILMRMSYALKNRGPDDEGYFQHESTGLAHRRLSIIDVEGGHQPVFNEDKKVSVILNGEIYNYKELSRELHSKGHRFNTNSDTEVLLHLYEEHGDNFINKLDGMFAFALFDSTKNMLFLARDKFGEKPLYFVETNDQVFFASEIKALKSVTDFLNNQVFSLNVSALTNYLSLQYVSDTTSIYQGVSKVQPGEALAITDGKIVNRWKYWKPPETIVQTEYETALSASRKLLENAVRSRLVSDVPVGIFLSGGIDSSIITALVSSYTNCKARTFTACFNEKHFDEAEKALSIAEKYNTNHSPVMISPDTIKNSLSRILSYMDEPFADPSAIPYALLCEEASKSVKVVLGGDGGDELFSGYLRYKLDSMLPDTVTPFIALLLRKAVSRLTVNHAKPLGAGFRLGLKRLPNALSLPKSAGILRWSSYFTSDDIMSLFNCDIIKYTDPFISIKELTSAYECRNKDLPDMSKTRITDLLTYAPGDYLVKSDRMGMRSGIEIRNPFLEPNLVTYALSLPPEILMKQGLKSVLKRAFYSDLTKTVLRSSKRGFSVPVSLWMKNEWLTMYRDLANSKKSVSKLLFNSHYIEQLISNHLSNREDFGKKLYALLALEIWYCSTQ